MMKSKIQIVPATEALIRQFYGDKPLPTMRAYLLLDDDKLVCIAGFIRCYLGGKILFSDICVPNREDYKISLTRFAFFMLRVAKEHGWPLLASPDPAIPTAAELLLRLGFEYRGNGEYVKWPV